MLVLLQSITFTQQEQFNLNKGKSLKWRSLRPCGSASLGLFPYVWPSDPKVSQASQADPLPIPICAAVFHMCVSVQSHPCFYWLLQVLSHDGKQVSISLCLSAEETHRPQASLCWSLQWLKNNIWYSVFLFLFSFFFHFAHAWQAVWKLIFVLFTAMELSNTTELQF